LKGGYAWRNFAITAMVNDPRVSNAESMRPLPPIPKFPKAQPRCQSSSSQVLVNKARGLVASTSNMQGQVPRKRKVMSAEQAEIRRLRMQVHHEKHQKLISQQNLSASREEHRLEVQDLETRLSDLQQNYQVNPNEGNWYRHIQTKRRFF